MQRCRFHVDEICTTCRFHEDKICKRADFMGITTFPHSLFTIPTGTFYSTCPIQKDRHQRIQRRQAAFLFSLIFLIAASHAASIFLCCVYGSHSFPYCFNCCKPCSFFIFLRCIWRPALSLIICLYQSYLRTAAAVLQAIFLFFL